MSIGALSDLLPGFKSKIANMNLDPNMVVSVNGDFVIRVASSGMLQKKRIIARNE
jgi:hypothetical protein